MIKSYTELSKLKTFRERFEYLQCHSKIGVDTFGWQRFLNQQLYSSEAWKKVRREIIIRDNGNDLGVDDEPITGHITAHHINPITYDDVVWKRPCVFDPDNLISCSDLTHKAIHYGTFDTLPKKWEERKPGDTKLW